MSQRKKKDPTETRARESDDDRTIYRILREEFTAADLQKYTEIETLIPAEQVLAELDKIRGRKRPKRKSP